MAIILAKKNAAIPSISQLLEQLIRVAGVWLLIQILTEQGNLPSPEIAVWGILFGEVTAALYSVTMLLFHTKSDASLLFRFRRNLDPICRFCGSCAP